jgi:iron(III) transport system permease protein
MPVQITERTQRAIYVWVLIGFAAYLALPWYYLQSGSLLFAMPRLFADPVTANGLTQAAVHGRGWLWTGIAGLLVAGFGAWLPASRRQGVVLIAGAVIGLLGLGVSGFLIGATGWSYEWLNAALGTLPQSQSGIGWGGFVALVCLVMLLGSGIARLGYFRGDVFVAAAVVGVVRCSPCLWCFLSPNPYPPPSIPKAEVSPWARCGSASARHVCGVSAAWVAGPNCGVAWNTLYLALLTAAGTTVLGTMIALIAERSASKGLQKPLNALAMLPIITPPFVVGLGLILLFGRAGIVNQLMEWSFGVTPTRWFYGVFGVWLAQLFAFTPIAFMIMRGVVQGISPSLEEAAQTLRASRMKTFLTVTLPLLAPGLANAFLVGFIESISDFGNPIILGSGYAVLSTEIFFAIVGASLDQGMAAALALVLTAFALTVFFVQRRILGKTSFTTVSGKGDAGVPMALPALVRRLCTWVAGPWLAFTMVVYLFAFAGGLSKSGDVITP